MVLIICYVEMERPNILWSTVEILAELRYLEISSSNLRALPSNIGNLTKLLVLQLMYNDEITILLYLLFLVFFL